MGCETSSVVHMLYVERDGATNLHNPVRAYPFRSQLPALTREQGEVSEQYHLSAYDLGEPRIGVPSFLLRPCLFHAKFCCLSSSGL